MSALSRVLFFDVYPFVFSYCPFDHVQNKLSSLNKRIWRYQVAHEKLAQQKYHIGIDVVQAIKTGRPYIFARVVASRYLFFFSLNSLLIIAANSGSRTMCFFFIRNGAYDIFPAVKAAAIVGHMHVHRFLVNFLSTKRQKII